MTGYAMAYGACIGCGSVFGFNPLRVPSVLVDGEREPVCRDCWERRQAFRESKGWDRELLHDDAYEAIPADELPND